MLKEALKKKPYSFVWQRLRSGSPSQRATWCSLALHLGLMCVSLSIGLMQKLRAWLCPQKPPLHVFSLESLPTGGTVGLAHSPHLESQPASLALSQKPLSTKPISKKKPLASIQFQPLPKPENASVVTSDNVPLATAKKTKAQLKTKVPKQAEATAKPKPPAPAKSKTPPKLSYEAFLKSQSKHPPSVAPAKSQSLDSAKLRQALHSSTLSQAQALRSGKGDLLGTYIGQMKALIDTVWKKPSGLKGGIEALVEFEVDAQGVVTRYAILKRSQHDLFDASIEAAFQQGLVLPPPPAGKQVFQLLFKSIDQ